MVDNGRLQALLERIDTEVDLLRALAGRDPGALLADPVALRAVKYGFVVAIEAAIDAAQRLIATRRLRSPATFADAFEVLGQAGLVPADSVPALRAMAGFRNLLVHGYLAVDDRRVVEVLRSDLGDLEAFRRHVAAAALQP